MEAVNGSRVSTSAGEILASVPDGRGGRTAIHAASGQLHASRRPRRRVIEGWLDESAGISSGGAVLGLDIIDTARAPTMRFSFDASRRNTKLFRGRVDVGLCRRLCFLLVGIGIEDSWRGRSPVVAFWGPRTGARAKVWDVYLLGADTVGMVKSLALLLATSGARHGLEIEGRRARLRRMPGSMSPLLRWDGSSVAMYNRDGHEIDQIFQGVGEGRTLPRLEARLGFPKLRG